MSYKKFALEVKSSLDFYAKSLADTKSLPFVDLAAESFSVETLESDKPAVCWEFTTFSEDPIDPLYLIMFNIGVMVFTDPAQYQSLDLISMFQDAFHKGARFDIRDYSGITAPTKIAGSLYVVESGITPNQTDIATGVRFVTVTARGCRNV